MADGGSEMARVIDAELVAGGSSVPESIFDPDAERAVLAAVMLDEGAALGVWRRVSTIVSAASFRDPAHATIWRAFEAILGRGEPVDVLTAVEELRARNVLNAVGGPQYISDLAEFIPTLVHCESHARLVAAAAARRDLGLIGARLARAAAEASSDPARLRDLAIETLRRVSVGGAAVTPSSATELLVELWAEIEGGIAGKRPGPLPFSVPTLDRMSGGGMKRGGAYFLAARPGIGKTSMACQVSGATAERGERVLYVALEPKRLDVIQSIVANRAGVALAKIARTPHLLSQDDMNAIGAASNAVDTWPVHVVDVTERSCPDTVAKVENAMRALPTMPALVVIDHLLKLVPVGRHEKEHHGTAQVVAALVSLGKRTGATILTLCHIGRGVSTSGNLFRRPRTEDIAGGDAMNRDADGIILLHREDKYPTRKDSVGNKSLAGIIDLLAPKLRGVEDNTFGRMRYRGEIQRFEALEDETATDTEVGGVEGGGYA
jgi:replicative DNA helicase